MEELINNRNLTRNNTLGNNIKSAKVRYNTCCQLRQRSRQLKNKWWLTKAAELQTLVDRNDPNVFYQSMRTVWGPKVNCPEMLTLNNKTIISEKCELLAQ